MPELQIRVRCPYCPNEARLPRSAAGKTVKCSNCGQAFAAKYFELEPVQVRCPFCPNVGLSAAEAIGKKIKCSSCTKAFILEYWQPSEGSKQEVVVFAFDFNTAPISTVTIPLNQGQQKGSDELDLVMSQPPTQYANPRTPSQPTYSGAAQVDTDKKRSVAGTSFVSFLISNFRIIGCLAGILVLAVLCPVIWGMISRAIRESGSERQERLSPSARNLAELVKQCHRFSDKEHAFPKTPLDLYPDYVVDTSIFRNPERQGEAISYYYVPDVSSDEKECVLFYETSTGDAREFRNVAFVDGRIEWLDEKELSRRLDLTRKELATKNISMQSVAINPIDLESRRQNDLALGEASQREEKRQKEIAEKEAAEQRKRELERESQELDAELKQKSSPIILGILKKEFWLQYEQYSNLTTSYTDNQIRLLELGRVKDSEDIEPERLRCHALRMNYFNASTCKDPSKVLVEAAKGEPVSDGMLKVTVKFSFRYSNVVVTSRILSYIIKDTFGDGNWTLHSYQWED